MAQTIDWDELHRFALDVADLTEPEIQSIKVRYRQTATNAVLAFIRTCKRIPIKGEVDSIRGVVSTHFNRVEIPAIASRGTSDEN